MTENIYLPPFEEIFKPVKWCFWIVGLPFQKNRAMTIQCMLLLLTITSTDFEEWLFLFPTVKSGDILAITSLIPCVITGMIAAIKFICLFLKRDKLIELTNNISDLYEDIQKDGRKTEVVKTETIFLFKITKYYSVVNFILLSLYIIKDFTWKLYSTLIKNEVIYPVPFPIIYPLPIDNIYIWSVAYLQCSIGAIVCISYVVGIDVLYCILTSQICINLSIVSNQIENIEREDVDGLHRIVKYHQYLLELSMDLEDVFTGPNFYNYLSASVQICVLIFNLSIADWKLIPQYMLFAVSILLQIFLMSIFGEKLIRESEKVGHAAYLCPWYNMNNKMTKILLFLRERAQLSQKLTAYKLHVISYASFRKIISSSWSYFTLLKTVYVTPEKNIN